MTQKERIKEFEEILKRSPKDGIVCCVFESKSELEEKMKLSNKYMIGIILKPVGRWAEDFVEKENKRLNTEIGIDLEKLEKKKHNKTQL